ncbi:MAG: hypothetical protein E7626_01270 [Ruminococcaceae bacterium]|nr:hypothetical protein [Oscillospiraceae bacterium]
MTEREKQIVEMANDLAQHCPDLVENCCGSSSCVSCLTRFLHNNGYRKQIEGKWLVSAWDNQKQEFVEIPYIKHEHVSPYCSLCKADALLDGAEFGVASNYCPTCGAKMKGGAE